MGSLLGVRFGQSSVRICILHLLHNKAANKLENIAECIKSELESAPIWLVRHPPEPSKDPLEAGALFGFTLCTACTTKRQHNQQIYKTALASWPNGGLSDTTSGCLKSNKNAPYCRGKVTKETATGISLNALKTTKTALVSEPSVGLSDTTGGRPKASKNTAQRRGKDAQQGPNPGL